MTCSVCKQPMEVAKDEEGHEWRYAEGEDGMFRVWLCRPCRCQYTEFKKGWAID